MMCICSLHEQHHICGTPYRTVTYSALHTLCVLTQLYIASAFSLYLTSYFIRPSPGLRFPNRCVAQNFEPLLGVFHSLQSLVAYNIRLSCLS